MLDMDKNAILGVSTSQLASHGIVVSHNWSKGD